MVYEVRPGQAYTLDELIHMASVTIANLKQGEAIVKIGRRPSSRVSIVRVADGWATDRHVAQVTAELAEATPYITLLASPPEREEQPSRPHLRVVRSDSDAPPKKADPGKKPPEPPPKDDPDDDWG